MLHVQHPDPSDPHWRVVGFLWGSSSNASYLPQALCTSIRQSLLSVHLWPTHGTTKSPCAHAQTFCKNGDA